MIAVVGDEPDVQGLHYYDKAENNWEDRTPLNAQTDYFRWEIANAPTNTDRVYALIELANAVDHLAVSNDRGRNWEICTNLSIGTGHSAYTMMLSVDPTNANRIVIGALGGPRVGLYSGSACGWLWSNRTPGHADHHVVANFHTTTNQNHFLVGNDGGYLNTDGTIITSGRN